MTNYSKIREIKIILEECYPIEAMYNSRATLFGVALKDGIITKEEYLIAKEYYKELWTYVGD